MKKALKSALAVVLALTMIMSCSFAVTASAAGANTATTSVSVSDIPQIIAGVVKVGIEVAKKAFWHDNAMRSRRFCIRKTDAWSVFFR